MAINFNGLATGLDTAALIEGIMAADRKPIERLENNREYQNARLEAYGVFNGALDSLRIQVEDITQTDALLSKQSSFTGENLVSATATTTSAIEGSYQIRSFSFAQVEKDVSQGYADKAATSFGTGTMTITVGTTAHDIVIDDSNNSMEGIMKAINNSAGIGVKAAIINDGTTSPYRLVVSGNTAGTAAEVGFDIDVSGLTGGSYSNPAFTETQIASQAHIEVDGVNIYSNSNVFSDAIPGVTLSMDQADNGATTSTMTVTQDQETARSKVQNFVSSYNMIMTFVSSQSSKNGSTPGLLAGDSSLHSVKRRLQNILTTPSHTGGQFKTLAEIGLETQRDGTLTLNTSVLNTALSTNMDSVTGLLAGTEEGEGIATTFKSYLTDMTSSIDGFMAGKTDSINRNVERMETRILQMEARLEQRQQTLLDQFTAMETLVSALNAQGDYLTQQMGLLENLWSKK